METNVKFIGEGNDRVRLSTITEKEAVALRKRLTAEGYTRSVRGYDRGRTSTHHAKGKHRVTITRHYQHPDYRAKADDKFSVSDNMKTGRLKTLEEAMGGIKAEIRLMFVVVDVENDGVVVGPFDSKEEAMAYFIFMANQEEWPEVIEAGDFPFENTGLDLQEVVPPDSGVRSKITY